MKRFLKLWLTVCVLYFFVQGNGLLAKKIKIDNPCLTAKGDSVHVADPFVYEHKGIYYLTGTSDNGNLQGFVCYTSKDMHTWTYNGMLYQKGAGHIGQSCFWAPEVEYYQGRFYMTYSCYAIPEERLLTCLAVSNNPQGPFYDLYTPWFDTGESSIDSDIFIDEDGTPYLYYSKNGMEGRVSTGKIYVVKLNRDLKGFDGEPVLVSEASQEWEKVAWNVNRCNEGPFVFKRKDVYYMTYSANDTGYDHYGIGVMTSKSPIGPWIKEDSNPMMTSNTEEGISSPGHNCVVEKGKKLYMVYHQHADIHSVKPNYDRIVCVEELLIDKFGKLRLKSVRK